MGKKDSDSENEFDFDLKNDYYGKSSRVYREVCAAAILAVVTGTLVCGFFTHGGAHCPAKDDQPCYSLEPRQEVTCRVPAAQHDEIVTGACTNGQNGVFFHCQVQGFDACGTDKMDMKWCLDDPQEDAELEKEARTAKGSGKGAR